MLPSSKTMSARDDICTNPCSSASNKTWWVVTTNLTLTRTLSQVDFDQLSKLSDPVTIFGSTDGIWVLITPNC